MALPNTMNSLTTLIKRYLIRPYPYLATAAPRLQFGLYTC